MSAIQPTPEQAAALATLPSDQPVIMINLLQFAEDGGEERYAQYGREVAPHLERVGARVIYGGSAPKHVIGEDVTPWWDAILIVEYPTPMAFVQMVTTQEYAQVHEHRDAALVRGDLIATSAWALAGDALPAAAGQAP